MKAMKVVCALAISFFIFSSIGFAKETEVSASKKDTTIHVSGNCGMCKAKIEKAAKSVIGVETAAWDSEEKILKLTFNDEKLDMKKVNEEIAKSGYDTDEVKATDKAYNSLPGCCQYR